MIDWQKIIEIIGPLFIGGVGGFGASWINYFVLKKQTRSNRRTNQIDLWRTELVDDWNLARGPAIIDSNGHPITHKAAYASLAAHLPPDFRQRLEGIPPEPFAGETIQIDLSGEAKLRMDLIDKINAIEKKWGLI